MPDVDVLVIGGGPAGLAAALELRRRGVERVVVADREEQAGGIPRHSVHTGFGLRDLYRLMSGPRYAARYVQLARQAAVELRTSTTVTGFTDAAAVSFTSPTGIEEIRPRAVLLATGCRERPRPARLVPGTRPLGVLTTGALQQLVYLHHAPVGRRAVVVGAEHVSFSAVLTLAHAGATTAAMVTEHPHHQTYPPFRWLTATRFGVPIRTDSRVTQILGARRVEAVEITHAPSGAVERIACDSVVFTGDWIADHELARRAGLEMDPATRAPRVDQALRTSRRGVFAAGNLLHGAETADVAALGGRHAAGSIRSFLDGAPWPDHPPLALRCQPPLRWVSPSAVEGAAPPPRGRFILRTASWRERSALVIAQGDRELGRRTFRRLIPNFPIHLPAEWVGRVDPSGPDIDLRIE